jgi:septum formation protein
VSRLILASASPARARLLTQAGLAFSVAVSGVEEDTDDVLELARRKAAAVAADLEDGLVLGCDSMFEVDGEVFGKPASADEARARWHRMRGGQGVLHTGHCVIDANRGESAEAVDSAVVRFAHPTDAEVDDYIATGEPLRVAGGFTLDGLGSPFVDAVDGNPGTVIGVSLPLLRTLLAQLDVDITSLWSSSP